MATELISLHQELMNAEARLFPLRAEISEYHFKQKQLKRAVEAAPDAASIVELEHVTAKLEAAARELAPLEDRVQTLRDEITDLKRRTLIADAREQMAIVQKRAQEATSALKLAFASLKTYNAEVATLIGHFSSGEQVLIYGVSNQPAIARWFQKAIGKAGIAANPDRGDGLTPTEIAGRLDAWLADR